MRSNNELLRSVNQRTLEDSHPSGDVRGEVKECVYIAGRSHDVAV